MIGSGGLGWQTVIADLALILFLVTASATKDAPDTPTVAEVPNPAMARWESGKDNIGFDDWIADLPQDQRTTVVLIGRYSHTDRASVWHSAEDNEAIASEKFGRVRTVLLPAAETSWSARLVYDGQPTP